MDQVPHTHSSESTTDIASMPVQSSATAQTTTTPSQAPVQVKKKRSPWPVILLFLLFFFVCAFCGAFFFWAASLSTQNTRAPQYTEKFIYGNESSENKILSISITGPIVDEVDLSNSPFSSLLLNQVVSGYTVKEQLMQAAKDDSIKGVILDINSPGGSVVGMRALADGVKYYREKTKKPVYAHIQELGASAAYYTAASTDKIIADDGSLIGAIGVILGPLVTYHKIIGMDNVITEDGIELTYFYGGKHKDFGNPDRPISDEERKSMQTEINDEYDSFVSFVSSQRDISNEVIRNDIQALIYGPKSALKFKLIDAIGNKQQAYADIASAAHLGDNYKVVRQLNDSGFLGSLFAKTPIKPAGKFQTYCTFCGQMISLYGDPMQYNIVSTDK